MEESGFAAMVGAGMGVFIAAVTNAGILGGVVMAAMFAVAAAVLWGLGSRATERRQSAAEN